MINVFTFFWERLIKKHIDAKDFSSVLFVFFIKIAFVVCCSILKSVCNKDAISKSVQQKKSHAHEKHFYC